MKLSNSQLDRARGVLVGCAVGDALGAGLEFGPVINYPQAITMSGGGTMGWEPGEWTDDTDLSIVIAKAAAKYGTLNSTQSLDEISLGFHEWFRTATDCGNQIHGVLSSALVNGTSASSMQEAALEYVSKKAQSDGNGSLMRTSPVALLNLNNPEGLARDAHLISALTHPNQDSTEACVIWCCAIRRAVLDGTIEAAKAGLSEGISLLESGRQSFWNHIFEKAESTEPWDCQKNGWVIGAIQAAWSAVMCVNPHEAQPSNPFTKGVDHAVRCGDDTDTVGAIAGALLGAIYGLSSIPSDWAEAINGWPSYKKDDLVNLVDQIVAHG